MREGKYVTLAKLEHDLGHISVHNAAAKQLEAIPPDRRKRIL
jgi:hypothetical protein